MNHYPDGAGKSSFDLIDADKFFSLLGLKEGSVFLDLGCGSGNYSIASAKFVGESGRIYALDRSKESMEILKGRIKDQGIQNIHLFLADIAGTYPIEDRSVDVCLLAGVFHHLVVEDLCKASTAEIARTLKQEGTLALVEFKKVEGPPGPPIDMRIAPEALEGILRPFGFLKKKFAEIGPFHYLMLFSQKESR